MHIYQTIIKPVTTEKSEKFAREGKYVFIIRKGASKIDVTSAVEKLYGVEVEKVNIVKNPAKTRQTRKRGLSAEKRPALRKAIVSLKGKKTLDVNKFKK